MKVVILGAKGMLGMELSEVFKEYKPFLLDKEDLDITDKKKVKEYLISLRPDLVINSAAWTAVDDAEKDENKNLVMKINGFAVGEIAKICNELGSILIHYSTDYVFSGRKRKGYLEKDTPSPLSTYGKSKYLGEKLLLENCKKFYLIRTSTLFGKYGKNFVENILNLAKEKEILKVVDDHISNPTYAKDLALKTLEIIREKYPYGIYHITNFGYVSRFGLAKKSVDIFYELTGKKLAKIIPCSLKEFPTLAKRPKVSILINSKVPFLRSWQDAVYEYISENLKKF